MSGVLTDKELFIAAAHEGRLEELQELLDRKVELGTQTKGKDNALHVAVAAGQTEMVRFLLSKDDEDLFSRMENENGQVAVELAVNNRDVEILEVFAQDGMENLLTALAPASAAGDLEGVELLIQLGANPSAISRKPALLEAAKGGHVAVAEVLLANGADVNVPSGHSPVLIAAAISGNVALIKLLLQHGARINETDGFYTPLRAAAIHGRVGVIHALLEHGAHNLHDLALQEACASGHVEAVALLFERSRTLDNDRRKYLMVSAAGVGRVEILEFLHKRGFDVNASDEEAQTPLHAACTNGQLAAVKWLLANNANAEAAAYGWIDNTPLYCAVKGRHTEVVSALLAHGVHVDYIHDTQSRQTVLHSLCSWHDADEEIARKLIAYGFDANRVDSYNRTPLYLACCRGHSNIAAAMLELVDGINVDIVAGDGTTALFHACRTSPVEIIRTLLDRGADPRRISSSGQTILHSACTRPRPEVLKLLLAQGVVASAVDNKNQTAWKFAIEAFHGTSADCESLELLMESSLFPIQTIFERACSNGWIDMVKICLKYEPYTDERKEYFTGALEASCRNGQIGIADLLLQSGAKPSYQALMYAGSCNIELVHLLLAHRVDPNEEVTNEEHFTGALEVFCRYGHIEIADLVLQSGAKPSYQALVLASSRNIELVQLLLAHKVDPNEEVTNEDNFNSPGIPLHVAACCSKDEIVKLLLANGANVHARYSNGDTALHNVGSDVVMGILLDYGGEIDAQNEHGNTPMHTALSKRDYACVETLVKRGADVNIANVLGETPFLLAASIHRPELIPLLIKHGADIHTRNLAGHTPLVGCIRASYWGSTTSQIYKTAYQLIMAGATQYEADPDFQPEYPEYAAVTYLVKWWIYERQHGKSLTQVPCKVVKRGQAAIATYINHHEMLGRCDVEADGSLTSERDTQEHGPDIADSWE